MMARQLFSLPVAFMIVDVSIFILQDKSNLLAQTLHWCALLCQNTLAYDTYSTYAL